MNRFALVGLLVAAACGGGNPSTQQTVGAAGATLQAGAATLTIPAGALSADTQVTLREAEPQHAGRSVRFEIEPRGKSLAQAAQLSIRVDDSNVKVKMHGGDDGLLDVEVEDRNHGDFKTSLGSFDSVEVELEHGANCTLPCPSNQECDDGACKAHGDDGAPTCSPVCASGLECDDGTCKAHHGG
ncbi:MAG TPA: hypothetical protein VH083_19890 [Myxococcales bacterium]|nr:hypothetical protein [Myxococcales bacterium]